jgi:hypothetical protein
VALPGAARELAFMHIRGDGTAVNGAFDLIAREGEAVRILDLKTSATAAGVLAERYRVQAAVYTEAVRAIAGAGDCDFTLLGLPAGDTARVTPAAELDALIARLRAPDAPSAPRPPSAPP